MISKLLTVLIQSSKTPFLTYKKAWRRWKQSTRSRQKNTTWKFIILKRKTKRCRISLRLRHSKRRKIWKSWGWSMRNFRTNLFARLIASSFHSWAAVSKLLTSWIPYQQRLRAKSMLRTTPKRSRGSGLRLTGRLFCCPSRPSQRWRIVMTLRVSCAMGVTCKRKYTRGSHRSLRFPTSNHTPTKFLHMEVVPSSIVGRPLET